ncbi:MAG: hypothetical protein AVO39_05205 [delta proteobacterium MLS_D]|nr:MAG: hypothetical protein AVO39_05205 [delta proteobacterium MLS_D]
MRTITSPYSKSQQDIPAYSSGPNKFPGLPLPGFFEEKRTSPGRHAKRFFRESKFHVEGTGCVWY